MADFSKITSPTGTEYTVKDETARSELTGKLNNPAGGTAGQVLKKTATGEEWADDEAGVESVNAVLPDANGNVAIKAENIPAQGYGNESTSGNPITITDGTPSTVKNLDVSLEPIQDLHGYDHPWPAGGGKNLFDPTANPNMWISPDGTISSVTGAKTSQKIETNGNVKTYTLSVNRNYATIICVAGYASDDTLINRQVSTDGNDIVFTTTSTMDYIYGAVYDSNYDVQLEQGSSSTAWTPYENICPISGYDSVSVQRTGKNLFDKASAVDSKYIGMDGVEESTSGFTISDYIPVIGNAGYILSGILYGSPAAYHAFYDSNKTFISSVVCSTFSLTAPSTAKYVRLSFMSVYLDAVQLEEGSTATSYEPYSSSTATINLTSAGTVYGGTLDFDTGVLTVDRAIVDLGTLNWSYSTSSARFISSLMDAVPELNNATPFNGICTMYQSVGSYYTLNHVIDGSISLDRQHTLCVYDSSAGTDAASFKTAMSGVQLVYELETPTTYQLTPAQLTLISDYNYITSNGTNISLDYYGSEATNVQAEIAEFETSIDRLTGSLATIETSPATAPHVVGDLIVWNSQLYKVISAIAVGESLGVGTNIQTDSVASELVPQLVTKTAVSAISDDQTVIYKVGRILIISLDFVTNATISGYGELYDMTVTPVGIASGVVISGTTAYPVYVYTDGSIQTRVALPSGGAFRGLIVCVTR